MTSNLYRKALVCGIMVLFGGAGVIPSVLATNETKILKPSVKENTSNQYISDDAEYYALIIGVEKFEGLEFPEEDHIDETATAMYEKLISSSNWKEENIKLLLNENATKENIHDAITNWLDDKETKSDVVLYYFTGHSWKMPIHKRLRGHTYTLPYDVSDSGYSDDKITDVELDSWLDELESRHVAVILDTCYSGRMLALRQLDRVILAAGGKYLFCSVDEDDVLGCGIFTYFLLQGFDGAADKNNDGWVSAEEVFRYARVPTFHFSFWKQFPFTKHLPLIIGPQLPYIYDCHLGELPLINLPFGWRQLTDGGFGKETNLATRGMAIYNGELYIGTHNVKLLKLLSNSSHSKNISSKFMADPFQEELFYNSDTGLYCADFGTLRWLPSLLRFPVRTVFHLVAKASEGCEVWKYNYTTDSLMQLIGDESLTGIKSGFNYTFNCAASVLNEFKDKLYVGTWSTPLGSFQDPNRKGCEIWRYDGATWEQVVGYNAPIMKGGFNNSDNIAAWSIEEFNDYLYVGTMNWGFTQNSGCEIWRTADGVHWEQVVDRGFKPNMSIADLEAGVTNTYAWNMEVFQEQLYVGTFNSRMFSDVGWGCQLWRTNDGKNWIKVNLPNGTNGDFKDGFGELENYGIRRMSVYNNELYVGTASNIVLDKGCEIWKYNGTSWTPIIGDDVPGVEYNDPEYDGFGSPLNKYVWSMAVSSDGKLWVGTFNVKLVNPFFESETKGCEIWCYDGTEWTPVVKDGIDRKSNGFGSIKNKGARSMMEYPHGSGNIVVGTFKLVYPGEGCEVWIRIA